MELPAKLGIQVENIPGKIKWFLLVPVFSMLTACSIVPGTYMSAGRTHQSYKINNQTIHPMLVDLNANWVAQHTEQRYVYKVGPYDILNVIAWNHPELTTPTTQLSSPEESGILVSATGHINFPFAGRLKVSGLTVEQIQLLLQKKLKKYIRNPQISVRVISFRSKEVQVLGEVGKQGAIRINDRRLTLFDAISQADGVRQHTANTGQIYIIRGNLQHLTVFMLNTKSPSSMMAGQQFVLKNNDIVYVPPAGISSWNRFISQIVPTLSLPTAQTIGDVVH